jgi:hypothetical protein
MFISFLCRNVANNLAEMFVLNYAVRFAASSLCVCFSIRKSALRWYGCVLLGFGVSVRDALSRSDTSHQYLLVKSLTSVRSYRQFALVETLFSFSIRKSDFVIILSNWSTPLSFP